MNTTQLHGRVVVTVKPQEARPRWERNLLAKAFDEGKGADQELRFTCRIAQDANRAFDSFKDADGNEWVRNPKAAAQFGRNAAGLAYLTVGVINTATDERVRLTWEGENVPYSMQETAVKHDEGKRVGTKRIGLNLSDAKVAPVSTPYRTPQGKRNHEAAKKAYDKRNPNRTRRADRLCAKDLQGKS